MFNRFIAIDVETSNSDRSSICQVGWVLFENGQIVSEFNSLVNPETVFLQKNIDIHRIRPEQVADAPTFAEVYPTLKETLDGEVVVHHDDFDWQSICHAAYLERLDLPDCEWLNTRKASQEAWTHLPNHKLKTLCDDLRITLVHHNALGDARACGHIFQILCEGELLDSSIIRRVQNADVANYTLNYPKSGLQKDIPTNGKKLKLTVEKGLGELEGLIKGILADNRVDGMELSWLDEWVHINHSWMSMSPWDELISLIDEIRSAPASEHFELLEDLIRLVNRLGQEYFESQAQEIRQLEGIFQGVLSDGVLHDDEVHAIEKWLQQRNHLKGHFVYDRIIKLVEDVLEDGVVSEDERKSLVQFMLEFAPIGRQAQQKLQAEIDGENQTESPNTIFSKPVIDFKEHVFCLSGDFDCFETKSEVEDRIQSLGGEISPRVTMKVNYLVVGGRGSAAWKFKKYGGKIEKALGYQAKDIAIEVIEESWLVSHL